MNLNKVIIPNHRFTESDDICLRGKVDTGTTCNYKCNFCYYITKLDAAFKPLETIKEEIDILVESGIKEFDLSGGESSIHPNFEDIIKYASQFGKVTTLSNGSSFSHYNNLIRAYNYGLRGILLSLHGWNEESH